MHPAAIGFLAEEHYVNIGSGPEIVGEVPTWVIGVFIDDDFVRAPEPVAAIAQVVWRDAPVPVVEPEAGWPTAFDAPAM